MVRWSLGSRLGSYTITNILNMCCNLVVVDDSGILKFTHLSIREFFEALATYSPGLTHAAVLQRCLDCYLRLNDSSILIVDLKEDFTIEPYAAMYWPIHCQCSVQDNLSEDKVEDFVFGINREKAAYQEWINDAYQARYKHVSSLLKIFKRDFKMNKIQYNQSPLPISLEPRANQD